MVTYRSHIKKITLCLLFLAIPIFINAHSQATEVKEDWFLPYLYDEQTYLSYIEADPVTGWYAKDIRDKETLDKLCNRYINKKGLIIPIFPTVYPPDKEDVLYYNVILKKSGIQKNDKILVIGSGSGADVWAAWLKSQSVIYAIDINPMAVINTRATAQIGNFKVEVIQGDIRTVKFPEGFSNFDYILWNMPFLSEDDENILEKKFHDGDEGDILDKFLTLLPQLLKKNGKAIILNNERAIEKIHLKNKRLIRQKDSVVCIITNS